MNTIPVRYDFLYEYAAKHRLDFNDLCRTVRDAIAEGSTDVSKVALDIAKWFINGDRPDEWKLKEWAERLDRDAVARAYDDSRQARGATVDSARPTLCEPSQQEAEPDEQDPSSPL